VAINETVSVAVSVRDGLGWKPITLATLERAVRNLLLYAPPDAAVTIEDGVGGQQLVATWPETRPRRRHP
jgi:hypothetical protein